MHIYFLEARFEQVNSNANQAIIEHTLFQEQRQNG